MKRLISLVLSLMILFTSTAQAGFALPDAVQHIASEAFVGDADIIGAVALPSAMETLGDRAFADTGVFALYLPEAARQIGSRVLDETGAVYVVMESADAVIAADAFDVPYIVAPAGSTSQTWAATSGVTFVDLAQLTWIGGFGYLCTSTEAKLLFGQNDDLSGVVVIPETVGNVPVTQVGPHAFTRMRHVTEIQLPETAQMPDERVNWPDAAIRTYEVTPVVQPLELNKVTASATGNITAGKTVLWAARAQGGEGILRYRFELKLDGETISTADYATRNYFSFTLQEPGSYVLHVTCMDDAGSVCSGEAEAIRVLAEPLEIVGVTSDVSMLMIGETITWTVETAKGAAPVQYSYTVLCDGMTAATSSDFVDASTWQHTPQKAGYYVLQVTCLDADATICQAESAIVTALSQEAAVPAAPTLIFADSTLAFTADPASAPTYDVQSITASWAAVSSAQFYSVTLEMQVDETWNTILAQDDISACSLRMDRTLFADVTDRTLFRFGICSHGIRTGEMAYSYFAMEQVVVDETLTVNGGTSLIWEQAHTGSRVRDFQVASQLPWTVECSADWLTCTAVDGQTLRITMAEHAKSSPREADITISNGANSGMIHVYQGIATESPLVVQPVLSTNANNPTQLPLGDFTLTCDNDAVFDHDYGIIRMRVSEVNADGTLRHIKDRQSSSTSFILSSANLGEAFKAGSTYVVEVMGFHSANYATCEVEKDALSQKYYFTTVDSGHSILVNDSSAITLSNILSETVFVAASNYFSCVSDADWLTYSVQTSNAEFSEVRVTAAVNGTESPRTGHLTFTCGTAQAVVTIQQESMIPRITEPAGLSTNESSPTTVYMNLNQLEDSYKFFLFKGTRMTIAKGSNGTYGEETRVRSASTYCVHDAWLGNTGLVGNGRYRLTVSYAGLETYYYIKLADNDGEPYDDMVIDNDIRTLREIGTSAQAMTARFKAYTSWKATTDVSWLTLSKTSGSTGEYTITVNAAANTTGVERTGIVTFASTSNSCKAWLIVEQSAKDFMEVYYYNYNGMGYEPYAPSVHCNRIFGNETTTSSFCVRSSLDYSVYSNASWITLTDNGADSLSCESGEEFTVYLSDNTAGAPRTGTLTVTSAGITKTISITQMPAIGALNLVSPALSTVKSEPTLVSYGDMVITWNHSDQAVRYTVDTSLNEGDPDTIFADGSAQYTYTIPQSWFAADPSKTRRLYLTAFDQYGYELEEVYYYIVTMGDGILVNGDADPSWLKADDIDADGAPMVSEDFVIQASDDWTAAVSASWINLSASSGASGDTLTVSLAENTGAARSGKITFTAGSVTLDMPISQCACMTAEKPQLLTPVLSAEKSTPTLLSTSDLNRLALTWLDEEQAWHYSLEIAKYNTDTARKTIAESGTLHSANGSYTFKELELEEGALYMVTLKRFTARFGYTTSQYYFTISPADAWVLVEDQSAYEDEFDGGEDHNYLDITASGYWNATTQDDWLMLYKSPLHQADLDEKEVTTARYSSYGSSSGETLCVSALANTGSMPRTGTVTITSGNASATITIKQYQNYEMAHITSPALSTTSSKVTKLPYEAVNLRWSAAQGGTGNYGITLYESESQRTGYYEFYEKEGITSTSYTIPVSKFEEGMYYRLWLSTEVAAGESVGESYYFQMGRSDELTANVILERDEVAVGQHMRVTVQASGGVPGYKYAYQLMQGDTVLQESAYENFAYYSFQPPETGEYYIRVYVKDTEGTVYVANSCAFQTEAAVDTINVSRSVWAATADAASISVTVSSSTTWSASASASWITVTSSGSSATISVSANAETSARSGSVTFAAGSATATLSITQAGQTASSTISLSTGVWDLTASSADVTALNVTSTGAWSVQDVPGWLSVTPSSGSGSSAVQIYAAANAGQARAAQLTFAGDDGNATLHVTQAGNELLPRVSAVAVTDESPKTGEQVLFTITASNTDTLIFTVDGTPYEQIPVTDTTTTFARAFSSGGQREVTFVPVRGATIGTASQVLTMKVISYGELNTPTLTSIGAVELGQSVTVSWNAIEHAEQYVLYVFRDDVLLAKEAAWKQTEYTLTHDVLSCAGTYVFQVMPTGAGYTQSEAAEIITVTQPATSAKLTAPKAGNTFDIGNTVGLQASNPEGRPMTMQLYKGDEMIAVFPAEGTTTSLDPYYEYVVQEAGSYHASMTVYGAAGNVILDTAKVGFTVNGPAFRSGSRVGTGARSMYADLVTSFKVVTNTAVTSVTMVDGGQTYTLTGGTLDTSNWTNVFTGTMNVPAEGLHKAVITATDDYGHQATLTLTYYAITRNTAGTKLYPQASTVTLYETPSVSKASATLYPSDTVTLLGSCGDYWYVNHNGTKGFAAKSQLATTRLTSWSGLTVYIPPLMNEELLGCNLSSASFNLYWSSSIAPLPESAVYRLSLVNESGEVTQLCQGSDRSASIKMSSLAKGNHTARVQVLSADGEIVYLTADSNHPLVVYSDYDQLFRAMDYEEYAFCRKTIYRSYQNFTNLYRFFTPQGYYDAASGTWLKVDMTKITENAVLKTYHAYFGDTLTALGEKELVRAAIAEAIVDNVAKNNPSVKKLKLDDFKNFLSFFEFGDSYISKIFAAEDIGLAGILNDYNPYNSTNFFEKLCKDNGLDKLGIMKGISTGIKGHELMASVWSKYVKFSQADQNKVLEIARQFRATGNPDLIGVAGYLEIFCDNSTLLTYLIVGYGGKEVVDYMIGEGKEALEKGVSKLISRLPGGFAFTIGAAIGKEIGVAINNAVFNVDQIQNKACELQWRIEAAAAYYGVYTNAYQQFETDPLVGYQDFAEKTIVFGEMIDIIYQGWADYVKAVDDAGWSKFVQCFKRDAALSDQAQVHADTLPALAITNLSGELDRFFYQFLNAQGATHVVMPSSWFDPSILDE